MCLSSHQTIGLAVEEHTFSVTKGETYYFVVDGFDGAVGGYAIEVTCDKQP